MAKSAYQDNQYGWQPSDMSTFAQQSQNLAKQAGTAGINEGQINVEKGTAQAEQAAGQTGQNVAAGASQVAQGSQVSPTIMPPTGAITNPTNTNSKGPTSSNPTSGIAGSGQTTNNQYTVLTPATAAPTTDVTNQVDTSTPQTFNGVDLAYLKNLFPNGIPNSIFQIYNQMQYNLNNPNKQADLPFDSSDMEQYQNIINNALTNQEQNLEQNYNKGMGDIATQTSNAQQAISDYINNLNKGLSDYQKQTQDLSNVGQLSNAEKNSAALNAFLSNPTTTSTLAAQALNQNVGNSKLAALSGQAQNAAIQQAIGQAAAAQQLDKYGQQALQAGQQAQANAYTNANNTIQQNQNNLLNKLQDSATAAKKQLNDYYNNSITNLNKEEQNYINAAQGTIKQNNIAPEKVKAAIQTTANMMDKYLKNNNVSPEEKQQMRNQLLSMWHIGMGSHPNGDMDYSNELSRALIPIAQQLQ